MFKKKALLIHGNRYDISPFVLSKVESCDCRTFIELDAEVDSMQPESQVGSDLFAALKELEPLSIDYLYISGLYSKILLNKIFAFFVGKNSKEFVIIVDHADFNSIYSCLSGSVLSYRGLWFDKLDLDRQSDRMGHCYATMSFSRARLAQDSSTIPVDKNKILHNSFPASTSLYSYSSCLNRCKQAFDRFQPKTEEDAHRIFQSLGLEFPDKFANYWHDSKLDFVDSFTWGHDHDFGFGYSRRGAMGQRHLEIAAESMQYGYLPQDLSGKKVLDIGCWSGGDLLILLGLGASVDVIEEHAMSAKSTSRLLQLLSIDNVAISSNSLYSDNVDLCQKYDIIYMSGVIYHVTDPLLAIRICFAYLKEGGKLIIETKASYSNDSISTYSGTAEKGWNWFSPSLSAMQRWFLDAGFPAESIYVHMRPIGRLLGAATKVNSSKLPSRSGFSRPGSWLEGDI